MESGPPTPGGQPWSADGAWVSSAVTRAVASRTPRTSSPRRGWGPQLPGTRLLGLAIPRGSASTLTSSPSHLPFRPSGGTPQRTLGTGCAAAKAWSRAGSETFLRHRLRRLNLGLPSRQGRAAVLVPWVLRGLSSRLARRAQKRPARSLVTGAPALAGPDACAPPRARPRVCRVPRSPPLGGGCRSSQPGRASEGGSRLSREPAGRGTVQSF